MMFGRNGLWAALFTAWFGGVVLGATPQTWELKGGRWVQANAEDTAATKPATVAATQPTGPDLALDDAQEMLGRRDAETARKVLLGWLKNHSQKETPNRDRAVYLLAEAYYQIGDRERAFYHCDEVMDTYPDSGLFYKALEMQYKIADGYLKGYKKKFLGMPILGMEDEAIEMLFRIQQRSPGSPLAERALLRTADYYYATSEFDLASDAYAAYVRSYPRSPLVPKVRLRQAFSALAQFRGLRFDATPLMNARAQLVDVINTYPELADEENLKAVVGRIDASFAQKILSTAEFYKKTNAYRAAAYHYRFLIKTYPDSPEAEYASRQIALLPAEARKAPEPPVGGAYSPATKPAVVEEPEK